MDGKQTRYEVVDSYVLRMSGKPGMDVMYRTCTAQVLPLHLSSKYLMLMVNVATVVG